MRMIFSNIKLIYKKSKLIYILMCAIQIIIVCTLLYTLAKIQSQRYVISNYNVGISTYTVAGDGLTVQKAVECVSKLDKDEIEAVSLSLKLNSDYNIKAYAIGEKQTVLNSISDYAIENFSYDEWRKSGGILLSIFNAFEYESIPDKIEIAENEYAVEAVTDSYLSLLLPGL